MEAAVSIQNLVDLVERIQPLYPNRFIHLIPWSFYGDPCLYVWAMDYPVGGLEHGWERGANRYEQPVCRIYGPNYSEWVDEATYSRWEVLRKADDPADS